jgi:uncharacterized linocin/CFP29 family protein
MTQKDPHVPWTDEQWARVQQVIQEEASRARVAATFLPLVGPLPPGTDFVRKEAVTYPANPNQPPPQQIKIEDRTTVQLATLQVNVPLRGAQVADPEMTSVLTSFRRAANVLARLEDAVVFGGLIERDPNNPGDIILNGKVDPPIWEIRAYEESKGLVDAAPTEVASPNTGNDLVAAVSAAIGKLEERGHFGPFAVVLDQAFFLSVQTPENGLVLPQDRIVPFLGGGPLLRSSALTEKPEPGKKPAKKAVGLVVALGGAPVELVFAKDVSLNFLQQTADGDYLFRVLEKLVLRIKEADAIVKLKEPAAPPARPV